MKKRNLIIFVALIALSSCASKLENFNTEYESFKETNKDVLNQAFQNLMSFENVALDESLSNKTAKEINLELSADAFNAILVDENIFDDVNDKPDALDLFNPITGYNLVFLNRMLKGEEEKLYFLESIRSEGFDFDQSSGPMMQYNEFISFAKKFPKTEYILINYPSRVLLPELTYEGFYPGEYDGTIALYDFQSKAMLSSFTYSATNSNAIYEGSTVDADYSSLYDDLNEQIEISIKEKIYAFYTIDSYDLEGIEFVDFMDNE